MKYGRRFDEIVRTAAVPLLTGLGTMFALDLARRVFRQSQLFCPERNPTKTWNPADYGLAPERVAEEWIETPDGEVLYAWYCRAEHPIASALYCHGNSGNLTTIADAIPHLVNAGFNVLLFDYRGFGRSSGRPSLSGVIADAITVARFHDRVRPQHLPVLAYGYSLGGAVAAQLVRRHPFDALILQSTFTNLPDIARTMFPRVPLHMVAGNVFDTESAIRRLQIPLLVVHGERDETIPCWMARRLYDACSGTKQLHIVSGGMHRDLYVRDASGLVEAVRTFVASVRPNVSTAALEPPSAVDLWIASLLRLVRRRVRRRTVEAL